MKLEWDKIKYLFQIPLEWFKAISNKVFRAYGTNFIKVKDGDDGAMQIDVDQDTFSQMVLDITGGGGGGGTVKQVDGVSPDASGNVQLGAIRSINNHYYPDADGNIDVGLGVASVNSVMPDANGNVDLGNMVYSVNGIAPDNIGNVNVGTVRMVNGTVPDAGGNVNLGTLITGVDNVTAQDFGMLHLNAVRTVNNISVDANYNVDVGTVKSVNGVQPDSDGNVALRVVATIDGEYPDGNGNINLSNYVKTVNSIRPDSYGNVQIATGVSSVNGVEPIDGDVDLGKIVNSVNNVEPDSNGNVELSVVESVNGITPIDGDVDLGELVYSVNGYTPDANGNVELDVVETVDGLYPSDGDIIFPIVANEWLKADSQGHITSTSDKPVVLSSTNEGYMYAHNGQLQFKNEEYVTLSTDQTITGEKNFDAQQRFRAATDPNNEQTVINGGEVYIKTGANAVPSLTLVRGNAATGTSEIQRRSDGLLITDVGLTKIESPEIVLSANGAGIRLKPPLLTDDAMVFISADLGIDLHTQIISLTGEHSIQLSAPPNRALLFNSPDENATSAAIATVGYVNDVALSGISGYVTLSTDQDIHGRKNFIQDTWLSIDIDRDTTSRSSAERTLRFVSNGEQEFANLRTHAYGNGTNELLFQVIKGSDSAWIRQQVGQQGSSNIHYRAAQHVIRASDTLTDGRVIVEPGACRIELFPNANQTHGGYIDFHVGGNTADYTARIIDQQGEFYVRTVDNKPLRLFATANYAQLTNAPTIARTDKTSKAIATCGWTNTVMEAALNNLNLDQFAKTADLTAYMTVSTNQTVTGIKTWHASNIANDTIVAAGSIICNRYRIVNNGNIFGELTYDSSIGVKLTTVGGLYLDAATNQAKLTNSPNESASDNCIATVGFVKNNGKVKSVDDVEPDSNGNVDFGLAADSIVMTDAAGHLTTGSGGVSANNKKVITGVSWNGTQLVISSESWTIENGIITSITSNSNETINTVTYN